MLKAAAPAIEVIELPPMACPGSGCDRDLLRDNMNSTDYLTDCIETPDIGVARFLCGKCGTCSEWKITENPPVAVYLRTVGTAQELKLMQFTKEDGQ